MFLERLQSVSVLADVDVLDEDDDVVGVFLRGLVSVLRVSQKVDREASCLEKRPGFVLGVVLLLVMSRNAFRFTVLREDFPGKERTSLLSGPRGKGDSLFFPPQPQFVVFFSSHPIIFLGFSVLKVNFFVGVLFEVSGLVLCLQSSSSSAATPFGASSVGVVGSA